MQGEEAPSHGAHRSSSSLDGYTSHSMAPAGLEPISEGNLPASSPQSLVTHVHHMPASSISPPWHKHVALTVTSGSCFL